MECPTFDAQLLAHSGYLCPAHRLRCLGGSLVSYISVKGEVLSTFIPTLYERHRLAQRVSRPGPQSAERAQRGQTPGSNCQFVAKWPSAHRLFTYVIISYACPRQ